MLINIIKILFACLSCLLIYKLNTVNTCKKESRFTTKLNFLHTVITKQLNFRNNEASSAYKFGIKVNHKFKLLLPSIFHMTPKITVSKLALAFFRGMLKLRFDLNKVSTR